MNGSIAISNIVNINKNKSYKNNWQRKKILESQKHQSKAFEAVNQLVITGREGRKITLEDNTVLTEFVSCSYLGLDQDIRVINAANKNLSKCGVTFPAARTRVLAKSFVVLEELLNKIFCDSHSVIFANLHMAHLGILPLLGSGEMPSYPMRENGPLFILDKTVHASLQVNRGLMSQFGEITVVDFNQTEKLENEFKKAFETSRTPVAIADSIGSMGGITPIVPLLECSEKYYGYLYLDDAHGTSVYGKHGSGYVLDKLNSQFHPRLILTSSLAKAFGAVAGVAVFPTKKDVDFVKRYAETYIFSGPPALAIIDSAIASAEIHLSNEIYELQNKLKDNLICFDSLMNANSPAILNYQSASPIRGIKIGDEFKTIEATQKLREAGFAVTAAMYPMVPKNQGILRLALGATHTKEEITALVANIKQLIPRFRLSST